MKKIIIIILVLISSQLSAQYTPLHLDIGTFWKADAYNSLGTGIGNLEIKSESIGDTTILGKQYYIVRTITKHSGFNLVYYPVDYFTYLRNDTINKKVFAYMNNQDSLIYDFDIQIGDTVHRTLFPNSYPYYTVDSIGFEQIYGVTRKVYYTAPTTSSWSSDSRLIEGIGTLFGFIAYDYNHGFENGAMTKCVKYNGTTLYGDSSTSCDLPLSISNIKKTINVDVFPNPISSNLSIHFNEEVIKNCNIDIKNIDGRTVIRQVGKIKNELNLGKLSNGIYILTIHNNDKFYSQKIIKD